MTSKKRAIAAMAVFATLGVQATEKTHWGYVGKQGPEHWGALDPSYTLCAIGKNQAPIDLQGFFEAELSLLEITYGGKASEVVNAGHTVDVHYKAGSAITVDGITFDLKQFHFHAPSEHHIGGQSFPMEVHFVHADTGGNYAVVGAMFQEGEANDTIEKLWSRLPQRAGVKHTLTETISPLGILPPDREYYRYNGSLTTPPCTEGVRWIVMKNPVTVSKQQIETFQRVFSHPNNRPLQPHNSRFVLQ